MQFLRNAKSHYALLLLILIAFALPLFLVGSSAPIIKNIGEGIFITVIGIIFINSIITSLNEKKMIKIDDKTIEHMVIPIPFLINTSCLILALVLIYEKSLAAIMPLCLFVLILPLVINLSNSENGNSIAHG